MRILALSERFQTAAGGSVTYVRHLCHQLARTGHEVYLVTERDEEVSATDKHWQPFDGYWIRSPPRHAPQDVFVRADLKSLKMYVETQMEALVAEVRPDVVHVLQGIGLAKALRRVPQGIPRVWTLQNVPPQEYTFTRFYSYPLINAAFKWPYFGLVRLINRRTLRTVPYDRLICSSEQTRGLALAAGTDKARTLVIPDGVDSRTFVPSPVRREAKRLLDGNPLILSVAGISTTKGQLDVVEAMPRIVEVYPEAKYINLGAVRHQPYYDQIRARLQDLDLNDRCSFLGYVSHEEKIFYYNACDVYIQPSHQEGFCLAALEAVSCGKPVVATHVGAMPEFVRDCQAGILIPPKRPEEIERAVIKMLKNPVARDAQLQHSCIAQHYSWEVVAERTAAVYRELAAAS